MLLDLARPSQSPALVYAALAMGTTFLGFSLNALLRPANALSFMADRKMPKGDEEKRTVRTLLHFYAARNGFMGVGIIIAALASTSISNANSAFDPATAKAILGASMVLAGGVAFGDGLACKVNVGKGEWDHWGYAPVLIAIGAGLLGWMDRA